MKYLTFFIAATFWVVYQPSVFAQWTIETQANEMDGTVDLFIARSGLVQTTRPLPYPYDDMVSQLVVVCDSQNRIAVYIDLLYSIDRIDRYSAERSVQSRMKFDNDDPISLELYLISSPPLLAVYQEDWSMITDKVMEASTVLLEIPLTQLVYFRYSLDGAADAILASPCR